MNSLEVFAFVALLLIVVSCGLTIGYIFIMQVCFPSQLTRAFQKIGKLEEEILELKKRIHKVECN